MVEWTLNRRLAEKREGSWKDDDDDDDYQSECESGMIFLLQRHDDGCFSPPAHF